MRAAASVVLVGLLGLGLSGCEFITPQQTALSYTPSDGVNGEAGRDVSVRNAFLVTLDGENASLIVSFINTASEPRTLQMQYATSSGTTTQQVIVPSGLLNIRPGAQIAVTLSELEAPAGSLLPIRFTVEGEGQQLPVPVLDNTLPGYETLTPTPTPTTRPQPQVTPTATESATPEPVDPATSPAPESE